jgi:hypothetical protein
MNSSGECSNCQLVSFASSGVCKRCGTKARNRWLTPPFVGIAAFAVIGVTLWALVLAAPKPAPYAVETPQLSVEAPQISHVVGERFASLAEQTQWLVDTTSIEDCQSLDRKVANQSPCETLELEGQAMRNICRLKKEQNPSLWEVPPKDVATHPDQLSEILR